MGSSQSLGSVYKLSSHKLSSWSKLALVTSAFKLVLTSVKDGLLGEYASAIFGYQDWKYLKLTSLML